MKSNKILSKREPFFSIIIPAYNCRKTIERLLNSIYANGLYRSEYEVIICNDKSTDNFLELVTPYEEKMNIVYCETTRGFHCPGNTREAALKYATGTWVVFIDNDDMFEVDALATVKYYLESNNVEYMICTNFREWNPETGEYTREFIGEQTDTWLHGKFFNRRNVIEKFDVHFMDDLYSHEDVYFNSNVLGNLIGNDTDYIYCNFFTYKWVTNPESLSRSYFSTDHFYIETYLNDYIYGASEPYFQFFEKYPEKKSFYYHQIMITMLHAFFYFDASRYRLGNKFLSYNLSYIHDFKIRICDRLGINEYDIINYIYSDPRLYNVIKANCVHGSNEFVETQSFKDFILSI